MASERKIFAVVAASNPEALAPIIAEAFPESFLSIGPGQWLIVGPSTITTQELSKKLNVSVDESVSNAVVLSVNSYFGRAPLNVWEWLTAKMGDASGIAG